MTFPDSPLEVFFDLVPTGAALYAPLYDAGGELVDFRFARLNPAGQRLLGLPAQPPRTFREYYPHSVPTGIFDQYRTAYLTGRAVTYDVPYAGDGLDTYLRLVAQRSGELLVVNFTDLADLPHSAVEQTLRESQAAEHVARAEAEAQRQRFYEVLMQLPAYVAVYHGPDHVYQFVNPPYQSLFPRRSFAGRPIREGIPEADGLGVVALFDRVYQTGEPYYGYEIEGWFDFRGTGEPEQVFLNLSLHPLRNAQGRIDGVLDFSHNITGQVLARRQAEQLNQELEARVQQRTHEAEAAHADAERQRARLESVFRQAPAAIAVYGGPDFVFELVNPVYQQLLPGRTLLGLPVRAAFPEVAALPVYATLQRVYETGLTHYEQAQLIPVAGPASENRYFDFTLQARYDEQHRVDGVIGFGFEVTAQVAARQQAAALQAEVLAAAQRQVHEREGFHQVFEQTPALIQLLRAPGHRIEYVNPAYQALFTGRPLVGLDLADALPELRAQGFIDLMDRVYRTGDTYSGTDIPFVMPAFDGQSARTGYFTFTYQAYRENGQTAGISIFAFEVTEQVLARQEREAQQGELQRIFEQAPVPITVLRGPDLVVESANAAISALWGRPAAETVGRPYFEAVPATTGQGFEKILADVLRTGRPFFITEMPVALERAHTGQSPVGNFNFVFQALFGPTGTGVPVGIIAVGTEVTDQVAARQQVQALNEELTAANQELQESNRQLTRTNVDLDTFVYTASHDLKAPIANIESIVLALRDTLPPAVLQDELVTHLLGLLDDTVTRFQFTIGQLTDISRLQLAHVGPAEPVELARVVEAVRLDLAPALAAAGTRLAVAVAPEVVLSFSPANLRSIVYNLLSNAVKYRAPDRPSQVQVRAEQTPQAVVLTVQDNGLGISELQQRQLFGLFQRLHTHVEGTGVGLYISKRLIENAGGTIAVQSQPDVGTTFTVTFPA